MGAVRGRERVSAVLQAYRGACFAADDRSYGMAAPTCSLSKRNVLAVTLIGTLVGEDVGSDRLGVAGFVQLHTTFA